MLRKWFVSLIALLAVTSLNADVLFLKSGSVMNGKITEKGEVLILRNAYGSYAIERTRVESWQRTDDYQMDIAILRSAGIAFDATEIQRNYEAGISEAASMAPAEMEVGKLLYAGVTLYGAGVLPEASEYLPYQYGAGVTAAFFASRFVNSSLVPDVLLETGYTRYTGKDGLNHGVPLCAGLRYSFVPFQNAHVLNIAALGGMYAGTATQDGRSASSMMPCLAVKAGYEYRLERWSLRADMHYRHVFDSTFALRSIGLELGLGIFFW